MKDIFINESIVLKIMRPIGKDKEKILSRVREYYIADDIGGYIYIYAVNLLDVGFVSTLVNGIE